VLFSTKAAEPYLDHRYAGDDILLFGRESAGVPDDVVAAANARVVIPIQHRLALAQCRHGGGHGIG